MFNTGEDKGEMCPGFQHLVCQLSRWAVAGLWAVATVRRGRLPWLWVSGWELSALWPDHCELVLFADWIRIECFSSRGPARGHRDSREEERGRQSGQAWAPGNKIPWSEPESIIIFISPWWGEREDTWVRPRGSAYPALSQSYIINMVSTDTAEENQSKHKL